MKTSGVSACLMALGLILAFMGIMQAQTSTASGQVVEVAFTSPALSPLPSSRSVNILGASAPITYTSTVTAYLPMLASPCHLPPGLPSNVTMTWRDAALYAGPGNMGYATLGQLKSCTTVSAQAVYGEFIRVEAMVAGQPKEGFLHRSSLLSIPKNLLVLNPDQVPWQNVDFSNHLALHPDVILQGADVVVDNTSHEYYNDDLPLSLTASTGFELDFQISTSNGQYGSIKLTDKQNNSSGDWWSGIRRVDFATNQGHLNIDVRDGISESSSIWIGLNRPDSQSISVSFLDPFGKVFLVQDQDGREIRKVDVTRLSVVSLPQGLFPQRTVYVGRVAPPHARLTIGSPAMQLAPTGQWQDPPPVLAEPTLTHLAEAKGVSVGTDFGWWSMRDSRYWNTMFAVYNTAILSDFSSTTFWRGRGDYDFVPLDRSIDWALRNGFRVRASHLVWGEYHVIPEWLLKGTFTREDYIQILHEHIDTVVGHYKGRVTEWNVANEATSRSWSVGNDFWADKIGPEYVEMALRWAREADPSGILILNDNDNHDLADPSIGVVASKMLALVSSLKAKGVPVDVVGMQMHLLLPWSSQTPPTKADVIDTMQQFANLGVKIYITEFDVNLNNVSGTRDQRWRFEAQLYREMVAACLESGVCTSFSTWGISDADSWLSCTDWWWCLKLPNADPLMFDSEYQPKPAFWAVYTALASEVPLGPR